ncbi:hypothetical protein ACIPSA_41875 [Streptomyces sp. NPDC086549]|uniref:hypothetical protein n=1 Tax=Streptomyces sp. NPDC086549 TaxID=3365752 RepID=UPI00380C0396
MRIEQTRRRLAELRDEGLVDRITLPQAGRTRVWFDTLYGVNVGAEWRELRDWRPPRLIADPAAARPRVGHALTVTDTGLAFLQDARRPGDVCRPRGERCCADGGFGMTSAFPSRLERVRERRPLLARAPQP